MSTKRSRSIQADGKGREGNEGVAQEDELMKLEKPLLPGLGNEVTLELIATKLPWRTFYILSSVSPAWRQAVQDRRVSDARVRAHSEETFVIISDTKSSRDSSRPTAVFLYSLRDNICSRLPPIPQLKCGFPYDCGCIALDGKVYILGGSKKCSRRLEERASQDVYVLDLAGQRQWKLCARMQEARANFRCGVKDGKVYVFGGNSRRRWVPGSEMYDPSVNSWSAITPIGNWPPESKTYVDRRFEGGLVSDCSLHNVVATGGEELIVFAGDSRLRGYCPVTDKWRTFPEHFPSVEGVTEFMAQGKLHSFWHDNMYVFDIEKYEQIERHSWSFASAPDRYELLISVLAVDNEMLAILDTSELHRASLSKVRLVRSQGFASDDKKIVWEELPFSFPMGPGGRQNLSMRLLKL